MEVKVLYVTHNTQQTAEIPRRGTAGAAGESPYGSNTVGKQVVRKGRRSKYCSSSGIAEVDGAKNQERREQRHLVFIAIVFALIHTPLNSDITRWSRAGPSRDVICGATSIWDFRIRPVWFHVLSYRSGESHSTGELLAGYLAVRRKKSAPCTRIVSHMYRAVPSLLHNAFPSSVLIHTLVQCVIRDRSAELPFRPLSSPPPFACSILRERCPELPVWAGPNGDLVGGGFV
jgi:hypothetical protein